MTTAVERRADPVRLPRAQAGAQPQHLIVTLIGDYWLGRKEHLPSAALVSLTHEFGISSTSARAALSRLARRGLLVPSKSGRNTFYGLTPRAEQTLRAGTDRIFMFGLDAPVRWTGRWVVVIFSVPEEQRDIRHALRSRLRWLGFSSLYDGVWVSPRPVEDEAAEALADLGVHQATVLAASASHPRQGEQGHPLSAWNLDELRQMYEDFVEEFAPLRDRVRSGQVSASEALVARTAIMDTWRSFPNRDPELPDAMLPSRWPRTEAREIFGQVYDALGPLAEFRFRQILGHIAPELATLVQHRTAESVVAEVRVARERRADLS